MSERVRQPMTFESCKVIGAGLVTLGISKSNILRFVSPADIKSFLEIVVLTFTALYTAAKACAVLWTLWIRWRQKKYEKPEIN